MMLIHQSSIHEIMIFKMTGKIYELLALNETLCIEWDIDTHRAMYSTYILTGSIRRSLPDCIKSLLKKPFL
jgi:hypothetical protein